MKDERQKAIDRLDDLAREYVKKRAMQRVGGCERCGASKARWKDLDWAHYHSKRKYNTRWDESNARGLCGGCHRYIDDHPYEKTEFFRTLLGQEEFDRLVMRAQTMMRGATTDYGLIAIYLKRLIENLGYEGP